MNPTLGVRKTQSPDDESSKLHPGTKLKHPAVAFANLPNQDLLTPPLEWNPLTMAGFKKFRLFMILALCMVLTAVGCRGRQHAHVLKQTDNDMVGSHNAGAETWKPLIDESVAKLLGKSSATILQASHTSIHNDGSLVRSICFVGVENKSGEVIGDFKEQIYDHVNTLVGQDPQFRMISRRYVEAAMAELRCAPESLILPQRQRDFQMILERQNQPLDYLLFARITSGTTNSNGDYQRDYLLTLELLDIQTGESISESAMLRKGYHKTIFGKNKHYDD
jgi:hypothetical protein